MKTIKISQQELAELLVESVDEMGSTDWDIFVNESTGKIDIRHNTYNKHGWIEIVDLYGCVYDDAETYDAKTWSDMIDEWSRNMGWLSDIEADENDYRDESEKIEFELTY